MARLIVCKSERQNLLEKEVVVNEFLLSLLVHAEKGVESALEIAFESGAGLGDETHDLFALLLGDARAKGEGVEVAAHANSRRTDHLGFLF